MENIKKSKRLVLMYSFDVAERLPPGSGAYRLGQILNQSVRDADFPTDPWIKFFEPWISTENDSSPVTKVISIEAAKLQGKWLKFRRSCSREDTLDLTTFEPTVDSVVEMVNGMNSSWREKTKHGAWTKVKGHFHRFCGALDSHSALLKLLPDGNEYVCIFTGSLNAIIKASVNHERVAEGLSEALSSISENVNECKAELEIFHTSDMLKRVAELYAHVFLFLSTVMDYLMKKSIMRMIDSFNENLFKKFEDEISQINAKSALIRNIAARGSRAEVRATRLMVEDLRRDVRIGLDGEARNRAEMEHFAYRIERELLQSQQERQEGKQLVARLTSMLQQGAMGWIVGQQLQGGSRDTSPSLEYRHSGTSLLSVPPKYEWTVEEVSINSAHLENFFHRDRIRLTCDSSAPIMIPIEVLQRMTNWTACRSPQALWIDGPPTEADDLENPVTSMALKFVNLASRSHIPIISYFCELRRGELYRQGNSPEEQGTIAMASGLLRQMMELLLPRFETEIDFSESRFRQLDGTVGSWNELMSMTRALVMLVPDTVFCVIDGLHWLDDRSTEIYLKELIQLLRGGKMKTLFTTTGRASCLREEMLDSEVLVMETFDPSSDAKALEDDIVDPYSIHGKEFHGE